MTISELFTNQDLDPQRLREAFGVFPSGVVAVAADLDGRRTGLAASSFSSVSIDPPLVQFSVANGSSTWPVLRRAPRLGLTVLADHHGDVCRQLAGDQDKRFEGLEITTTEEGALFLDEGLAHFDCSIYREVEAGDHTLVLLELHAVAQAADVSLPLVFHRSGFSGVASA